jgi:competence CoiA-like predicted nuclease
MPLRALLDNQIVEAYLAERHLAYKCRFCASSMFLKRGEIKIAHFAHVAQESCISTHKPESAHHLLMKVKLNQALAGSELEVRVEEHIFDVRWKNFVFECQASPLSMKDFYSREECAKRNGLEVCWIFGCPPYGITWHTRRGEVTRLKALELILGDERNEPLFYCDERGIFWYRHLEAPAPRMPHEFDDGETECKTKWFFEESRPGIEEILGHYRD